jgi:hypothetical protein
LLVNFATAIDYIKRLEVVIDASFDELRERDVTLCAVRL